MRWLHENPGRILAIAFTLLVPKFALCAGLSPWQFGMTKEQVKSFNQFGPYKSFLNGDLETFNGVFHGRKENIQFFFQNNRLVRIGVYLWEGKDSKQGIPAWRRAYELLQADYGKVVIPDLHTAPNSAPLNADVLAIGAAVNAYATGNTHMAPVKQPKNMRVFARFFGRSLGNFWDVAIFLIRVNAKGRAL